MDLTTAIRRQLQAVPGRKGILAEARRYSLFDEELIIREFFQDRENGFFLDVGCAWPVAASNTYYLEKHLGWKGIGVDALQDYDEGWKKERPHSRFLNYVVTDHSGTTDAFFRSPDPGLSSASRDRASATWLGMNLEPAEIHVPAIRLDDLLQQEGVGRIDLLTMDLEGHELQALAGFDIERFQPELVVVENPTDDVIRYFDQHGYALLERYRPFDIVNGYFARKAALQDVQPSLPSGTQQEFRMPPLEWVDDQRFMLNGRTFRCCELHQYNDRFPADEHVILKSRHMIEALLKEFGNQKFRNVLELGIARGGSTVWLDELLNPAKLVAIDVNARPVEALERYRLERGRTQQLVTYYGVDQKDEQMLRQICDIEFQNQSLDLIIDDASHFFQETSASFNFLFPRLAAGGLYVIEDWAWSLNTSIARKERIGAPAAPIVDGLVGAFAVKKPMAPLVCYIMFAAADGGNMIDGVRVDKHSAYVRRGGGHQSERFDVTGFNRFHDGSCLHVASPPPAPDRS